MAAGFTVLCDDDCVEFVVNFFGSSDLFSSFLHKFSKI